MQKLLFYSFALSVFIAACKKTEAPVGFDNPVFMVSYGSEIGNPDTTITAGVDGVYLFTRYEINDEVFHSINTFTDVNCPEGDCAGSLSFEFRHSVTFDSAFNGGIYNYSLPDSLAYDTTRFNIFVEGLPNAFWTDQTFTIENSPLHNPTYWNLTIFGLAGIPGVATLEASGTNGTQSYISRTVFQGNDSFPSVYIVAVPAGNTYLLTANAPGISPDSIRWSTQETGYSIFADSIGSINSYFVTVTDYSGNTAVAGLSNIPFPPAIDIINANFKYTITPYLNPYQKNTIAIQWVDANGMVWRSDRNKQIPAATFQVLESADYEPNENGDKTRKLKVTFNCLLFNEAGESREFSGIGTIAMARP